MRNFLLIILISIIPLSSFSQEHEEGKTEHEIEKAGSHKVGFLLAYTWVNQASLAGSRNKVLIPTFGLFYEYWFIERMGLVFTTDIEVGIYEVEIDEPDPLTRRNALVFAGGIMGNIYAGWSGFILGGIELERNKNLGLLRLGTAYTWELPKHWEVSAEVSADFKKEFNSAAFAVSFGKMFGKPKRHKIYPYE